MIGSPSLNPSTIDPGMIAMLLAKLKGGAGPQAMGAPLAVAGGGEGAPGATIAAPAAAPAAVAPAAPQRSLADIMTDIKGEDQGPDPAAAPMMAPVMATAPEAQATVAPNVPAMLSSVPDNMQGKKPGFFDRVGDYLKQPDVSAALFRSGAATLNGGLGAGLQAAAGYMDQQRGVKAKAAQQAFDNAIETGKLDLAKLTEAQKIDLARMGVNVDIARLGETSRHNRADEGLTANDQRVKIYGIDTNAKTAVRGQDVSVLNNNSSNAQSDVNNQRSTGASIYGTNMGYAGTVAGIGSKNQGYSETATTTPSAPGSNGFFGLGATAPAPKVVSTTRIPLTATPPAAAAAGPLPPPKPGDVVNGKTFQGGDPRNPKSWK